MERIEAELMIERTEFVDDVAQCESREIAINDF